MGEQVGARLRFESVPSSWFLSSNGEHDSQWAAIVRVAGKVGCTAETLRNECEPLSAERFQSLRSVSGSKCLSGKESRVAAGQT